MPDAELASTIPRGYELLVNVGVIIGTAVVAIFSARKKPEHIEPIAATKTDVVVTGGSFNDARPLREAVDELRRLNSCASAGLDVAREFLNVHRDMLETMQAAAIEERVEREVHARMAAIVTANPAKPFKRPTGE